MDISAKDVMALRQATGVGMMECKKALIEAEGNMEKAQKLLAEQGKAKVAKKAGRIAAEGVIGIYDHMLMHQKVAIVELNCETDFAAKNPQLIQAAKDIAMQVVASSPMVVRQEELDPKYVEEIRATFKAQVINEGKPEAVADRIVEGKLNKHFEEVCLLKQAFVKDPTKTVQDVINELTLVIGEKITIRRFVRYEVGEGLEKRNDDFAAEVAAQAGNN